MDLHGKIALVTGAAKRLGRAIAIELARSGCDVAIHHGHSPDSAHAVGVEISQMGRRTWVFQADLARPEQIERMMRAVGQHCAHLDVLVNNAGIYERTPIETLSADAWDAIMAVNARAPALCISKAIGLMTSGGAIINITDIAAEKAFGGYPAYCASKAALIALTKSAARSLAQKNIRVNSVAPGVAIWQDETPEDIRRQVLDQIPMHRPGTPEDIAAAVAFLSSQDYITGQNLRVDGGWLM